MMAFDEEKCWYDILTKPFPIIMALVHIVGCIWRPKNTCRVPDSNIIVFPKEVN